MKSLISYEWPYNSCENMLKVFFERHYNGVIYGNTGNNEAAGVCCQQARRLTII